jgi:glycosyltransferase involved in cell wall biosynthesis
MNILMLSPVFPFPPDDGDRLRIFYFLKQLSKKHDIYLACFSAPQDEKHVDELKKYCAGVSCIPMTKAEIFTKAIESVFSGMPVNAGAYKNKKMRRLVASIMHIKKIDLIFAYRMRMAQYAEGIEIPKVIDIVDSLAFYNQNRKEFEKNIFSRIYMAVDGPRILKYEKALSEKFKYVFINSEQDRDFLNGKNIIVVPNGAEGLKTKKKKNMVFTAGFFGNMAYPPNRDAVLYFIKNIWKKLLNSGDNIKLIIAGKGSESLNPAFAKASAGKIEIKGYVDDIVKEISSWDLSLVPVRYGAGRQNKILLSWLASVPVLATPFAAAGVYGKDIQNILIAQNEDEFIKKIALIKDNPKLAKKITAAATKTLKKNFDWKKSAGIIEKYIRKIT